MKKQFKLIFVSISLLFTSSCYDDDFLKDELLSSTSIDFLYSSSDGIANAVIGLYALNRERVEGDWENGAFPLILQAKSDLSAGVDGQISLFSNCYWGCGINEDWGGEQAYKSYWERDYRIIDITNSIIQGGDKLIKDGNSSKELLTSLAEARAFRAHAYFTLYRLFQNIYISSEVTTPQNAFDRPTDKSSKADIFKLIREDLLFASDNLDYGVSQLGRWNKGAVDHVRAKVEMWDENYEAAAEIVDEIITKGGYDLVEEPSEVFAGELNHSETLFAYNFEKNAIGGGVFHVMNWVTVARYATPEGIKLSKENGGAGYGFMGLNPYVVDLLNEDPNDKRIGSYYIFEYLYNDPEKLPSGKSVGDPLDLYDRDKEAGFEFIDYFIQQNPGVLKFNDPTVEATDRQHYKNIMVYRLAETYLIGAEAHFEEGNNTKALEYLNKIRERAGLDPETTVTIENIFEERARELAFEGQRWYSLKRKGLLYDYLKDHMNSPLLNNYYDTAHYNPIDVLTEDMVNLKIPSEIMELLGPNYPQNTGY
jgi:hypothetical protein